MIIQPPGLELTSLASSLFFKLGLIINHTRVLFKMGVGNATIQSGIGLPIVEGGGRLMTHSAGSGTTQSIHSYV